jgi:hypothetical protein
MLLKWGVYDYSDVTKIATQITKHVNSNIKLKYNDIDSGRSTLTEEGKFKCTEFIGKVEAKKDQRVNCTDCATIISTFSNLLGTNLYQVCLGIRYTDSTGKDYYYEVNELLGTITKRYYPFLGFNCNKVKSIGYNEWQYPFGDKNAVSGGFAYHEIAFSSGQSYLNNIYDACLKTNSNAVNDPNGKKLEQLPTDIQFAAKGSYVDSDLNKLRSGELIARYKELLVLNTILDLNRASITGYSISNTTGRRSLI